MYHRDHNDIIFAMFFSIDQRKIFAHNQNTLQYCAAIVSPSRALSIQRIVLRLYIIIIIHTELLVAKIKSCIPRAL